MREEEQSEQKGGKFRVYTVYAWKKAYHYFTFCGKVMEDDVWPA